MRQTLLRIPLDGPWSLGPLGEVPGFGIGLVLLVWIVGGIVWFILRARKTGVRADLAGPLVVWLGLAAVIVTIPYWVQRNADQRITAASQLIQQQPDSISAYLDRGAAFVEKREFARAITDFQRVIELAPDRPAGYVQLAWLWATCPDASYRNGEAAIENARRACEQTHWGGAIELDTLAAAYAEAGQFSDAVAWEQRAAQIAGESDAIQLQRSLPDLRKRLGLFQTRTPYRDRVGSSIPVFGYGFMLFLGFVSAGWLAARRAIREGLPDQLVWDLAMWLFVSGVVGARLFYLIQKRDLVFENVHGIGAFLFAAINLRAGGLVLYGGVLLGIVAYTVFCRRRRLDPLYLADLVVPSIFLGLAFGRLGCFMNGCCYGHVCHLPWKVVFPLGSVPDMVLVQRGFLSADALSSLPLHPTQIYSSLNALVLTALTIAYFPRRRFDGAVTVLALVVYPITRILLEIVRGDELGQFGTALTISQWVSLGMLAVGITLGICCEMRRRSNEGRRTSSAPSPRSQV